MKCGILFVEKSDLFFYSLHEMWTNEFEAIIIRYHSNYNGQKRILVHLVFYNMELLKGLNVYTFRVIRPSNSNLMQNHLYWL